MFTNTLRKDDAVDGLLSSLNPEQHDAVVTLDKALLVLSGAGTGKTKVLTTKIAYLIEGGYALPHQILAVTFSNKAANEMKNRLNELVPGVDGVTLGTFHAVCAKILRKHAELIGLNSNFTIIGADDQLKIIKQILKELNVDSKITNNVCNKISRWKDKGISSDDARLSGLTLEERVYSIYQERIRSYNSVDFGDLLLYVIQIFKNEKFSEILQFYRNKYKYILVDEYQDTNMSQYMWLRMLSPYGKGLCCVGDDDQAIYSWRGAEVGNILRFERDFENTHIIRLEKNYRSVGNILKVASSIISHNINRLGKTIWTERADGEKITIVRAYNGYQEAQVVVEQIEHLRRSKDLRYGDVAILVRAGFQTREFEERLIAYGLPYKVVGGLKFYDRQEIKDIIAYMRLVYQLDDSLAFERIINTPKRGIGASVMSKIHACSVENGISLYKAAKSLLNNNELRPSVKKSLSEFLEMIEGIKSERSLQPVEIARMILEKIEYINLLKQEKTIEADGRIENLKELLIALEEFDSLGMFIDHVSLVMDKSVYAPDNVVSIMTLHGAKGLEFDAVFLVGWEEGIFPSNLSVQEGNLEEERRLAYVGVTRAKKYAFISYAQHRKIYNQWQNSEPSRFLSELPSEYVEICYKQ